MTRAGLSSWIVGLAMALPAAAFAEDAYTTTAVNLRAGPDAEYPLVRWVPEGTAVNVHGCLADYRWCDVEVYGDRGWMSASFLVYPYQSSNVPIVTYGAVIGLPLIGFSFDSYWDDHYRQRPWYGDRDRWAQHHRPEYFPPRYRPPLQHTPPQHRPPQHRPPQHRPPQYYPPAARPEYRPPLVQPGPQPYHRGRDEYGDRPQLDRRSPPPSPGFRPPAPVRQPGPPPSARPPGLPAQPPSARPWAPPRPSTQGPTVRGRDPHGLRHNSGERGGMHTGNH